MPHTISPYDRRGGGFTEEGAVPAFMALALSFGFHLLLAWLFIVGLPLLTTQKRNIQPEIITVHLGDLIPPAPAAPDNLPVNPRRQGPDVVEATGAEAPPIPRPPIIPPAPEALAVPPEVIALGKKAPAPPPRPAKKAPPQVKPPRVESPEVKKRKAADNADARISKKMRDLERTMADKNLDDEINSRMWDLSSNRKGSPDGEGSQAGGSSGGQRVHPEMARYYEHIRDIIKDKWVPPPGVIADDLQTIYRVTINPNGSVSAMTLEKSSGHADFDLSVERAIRLSSPLPPLPPIFEGRPTTVGLRFNPQDLR